MQIRPRPHTVALGLVVTTVLSGVGWNVYRRATAPAPVTAAANPDLERMLQASAPTPSAASPNPVPTAAPGTPPVASPEELRVHVAGAVRKPGVYRLPRAARVQDAMDAAGGPLSAADLESINLADFLKDGEQVRIPRRGQRPAAPAPPPASNVAGWRGRYPLASTPASSPKAPERTPAAPPAAADGRVNINTAALADLDTLPGVGPVTAQAILDYRAQHGPFQRVEDIQDVRGIGAAKFEKMRERITVR